jgi:hypothetical protein
VQVSLGTPTPAEVSPELEVKPSACESIQSILGHVVDKCDSVCFEIEGRMDSFATVLTALKCYLLLIQKKITLMSDECIPCTYD